MSDQIKHECGIALIRLLKPLEYYKKKYGTWMYGLNKMYLLMEKQHNRGQDGAGMITLKYDMPPGVPYINRQRSNTDGPIKDIFSNIRGKISNAVENIDLDSVSEETAKQLIPFLGEVYMGHLRYGTFGQNHIKHVHPVMRQNNWKSRNLVLCGNFNLTNVSEIFEHLVNIGQHPKDYSDTITMLENLGHYLDEENQELYNQNKDEFSKKEISSVIARDLNVGNILRNASKKWDGGYVVSGVIGHGDSFVFRDPAGIRPAFYYYDDEIAVVTSEKPVIQTVLDVDESKIHPLSPGKAIIIKKDGSVSFETIKNSIPVKECSFERIYFSRGSDAEIYQERKKLGKLLTDQILESVNHDFDNTVFSFIPNTAETAFFGMVQGMQKKFAEDQKNIILSEKDTITPERLTEVLDRKIRIEKVAVKDVKLRTFISADAGRDDMVKHVYDITYGSVRPDVDNLVVIDDSIVRGTTLKQSIIQMLARIKPKKIIIVSSAPQIRYPDCYGIDMAKIGDFCAFKAAIALLKDNHKDYIINDVYKKCKEQQFAPKEEIVNHVKGIFEPFTADQISKKIAEILTPENIDIPVEIIYQTVDNLHKACPNHIGDWYFTGDYPTPGGNKVVNTAFINYVEGNNARAY